MVSCTLSVVRAFELVFTHFLLFAIINNVFLQWYLLSTVEEENETKAKINKNQIDSSQSLARTGISLFPRSIKILFRKSVSVIGEKEMQTVNN